MGKIERKWAKKRSDKGKKPADGTKPVEKKKFDNKFTKKRKEIVPNKYAVKDAEKRKEIGTEIKTKKEEEKIAKQALKAEKIAEREERSKIMRLRTKKGQPALTARIGLFLKDLQKNPELYKADSTI